MKSLRQTYEALCKSGRIQFDAQQVIVLNELDLLTQRILNEEKKRQSLLSRFRKKQCVMGLYIHGHVGAGKSFMMDTFFQALPISRKKRVHFHAFMKQLHDDLKMHAGKTNPIQHIVKAMAKSISVLCFDEFIVTDIADAMTLQRVLTALFNEGICVVLTSNTEPDMLYLKGLQRHSFLPTIPLIKKHLRIIACETSQDYRLRHLKNAGTFYVSLNAENDRKLSAAFDVMRNTCIEDCQSIIISEREIPVIKVAGDCVWFNFDVLCHPPRSQVDYLALVQTYSTVFISNIPVIKEQQHNIILLFIRLIDILYDAKCKLICTAEKPPYELYPAGKFIAEYQRTCSRLIEMQSEHYVCQTP